MATLVHDDVLDAAPLRRGRPTVVARAGRATRDRGRRPAVLARLRRARRSRRPGAERRVALLAARLGRARARRAGPAPRRLRPLDLSRALPRALPAEDGAAVRVRLPDRRRAEPDGGRRRCATFGREIGLAFQLLDDVLDVTGPPERTGKARGTDLLDGTVTLPLILARERDPGSPPARPARARRGRRGGGLRADRGHRRARRGPRRRRERASSRRSARSTAARLDARRRELLTMVADGVVERYS